MRTALTVRSVIFRSGCQGSDHCCFEGVAGGVAEFVGALQCGSKSFDFKFAGGELSGGLGPAPSPTASAMSRVKIPGRAVVSVLKENRRHGKTTIDPG